MRKVIPKKANLIPKQAKRVFKGVIYEVYQWQQQMYDGSYQTFEMLKRPDSVRVIAVKNDKIIVLHEEQVGYGSFYDIPGGRHDIESEDELQAAQRELLEETGMKFRNWKLLEVSQGLAKIDHFLYIFLATDFESQISPKLDSGEKIEVLEYDFEALKNSVQSSDFRFIPKTIIDRVKSIDELKNLPSYTV